MKPTILVIVGTTRQNRSGRKVADWYMREVQKINTDLNFELYDLADLDLEVFNESITPLQHKYNSVQQKIADKIASADGFVFVTGEYNHSIPGSLKNFLDYINAEWGRKPAAFVGYGSMGGVRAISQLVQTLAELRVTSLSNSRLVVTIRNIWEALDENDNPKPEFLNGNIAGQIEELGWWTKALAAARN